MTKARLFLKLLHEAGFIAYLTGGCVRDGLLGRDWNDEDIATNATPEQVKEVLASYASSIVYAGETFGVSICDGVEIAMFRTEKYNKKGRPVVQSTNSPKMDAARRDYTINSLFQDIEGNVIDFFGGVKDIENRIIRAVGDPHQRIDEDPSRIIRGVYLEALLHDYGFTLEENTLQAIKDRKQDLNFVAEALKGKYLMKAVKYRVVHRFVERMLNYGLMEFYLPELHHLHDLPQNPAYHHLDAGGHTVEVIKSAERNQAPVHLVLAAMFHDNAKGLPGIRGINEKYQQPNDIGHEEAGVIPAENAIVRFNLSLELAKKVSFFVRFHGIRVPVNAKHSSFVSTIRRMAPFVNNKEEIREKIEELFVFMGFDADGFTPEFSAKIKEELPLLKERLLYALETHIYYRSELPITGSDLVRLGFEGKQVGDILEKFVLHNYQEREEVQRHLSRHYNAVLS